MTVNRKLMAEQLNAIKSAANYGHWHEVLKSAYALHNLVLNLDNRLRRYRREIRQLRHLAGESDVASRSDCEPLRPDPAP